MRRLILGSILLLPFHRAAAQVGVSLLGGFVSSTISGQDGGGSRSGFAAGIGLTTHRPRGIDFAPEVLYVQKGMKFTDSYGNTGDSRMTYVEGAALFRLNAGHAHTHFMAFAGPYITLLASCSSAFRLVGGPTFSGNCKSDDTVNGGPTSAGVGIAAGGGIVAGRFAVTARYEIDVTTAFPGGSEHNQAILLMLGYAVR